MSILFIPQPNIPVNDYSWLFKAFRNESVIDNFNPKILRSLQARQYKLIREDIPKSTVQVNYEHLTQYSNADGETLVTLYGIADAETLSSMNANFPYTLTALAKKIGYDGWYPANELIKRVDKEKGFSMKSSDNIYHIRMQTDKSYLHFYSETAVKLLQKIKNNEEYDLELE